MPRITLALATAVSFTMFSPVAAQDFEKGYNAYQAGVYVAAVQAWKPLTDAGRGFGAIQSWSHL
jgi:hypothetical protein